MSTPTTTERPSNAPLEKQSRGDTAASLSRKTIKDLLMSDGLKQAVKMALPRHLTPERFMRVALNATMRQPDLLECTKESFFRCLLDLSAYGLEPDGRRAHLIPFNNKVKGKNGQPDRWQKEVQLIIDYKGLAELVRRSGDVSYIHADVVYEKDEWEFQYGSGAMLKHKPNMDDRGKKVIAIYSFVKLRDGSEDFIVLSRQDVEKVRERSKAKDSGPWKSDWDEMAKKTAFRRHTKWLPLSPEIRDVTERDDAFAGVDDPENTTILNVDVLPQLGNGEDADTERYQVEDNPAVDSAEGLASAADIVREMRTQAEAPQEEPAQTASAQMEAPKGLGFNDFTKEEWNRLTIGLKELGFKSRAQQEDKLNRFVEPKDVFFEWLEQALREKEGLK